MAERERLEPRTLRRAKFAVLDGLGFTVEKASERIGVTRQTHYNDVGVDPEFFRDLSSFVSTLKDEVIATEISRRQTALKAEDRIKAVFDRSFRITERLIDKAEEMGDEITVEQAMEIHKNITMWAAKFAASEAPKRVEVKGAFDHKHQVVIHDETVAALAFLNDHMTSKVLPHSNLPALPEAQVIDVEHSPAS